MKNMKTLEESRLFPENIKMISNKALLTFVFVHVLIIYEVRGNKEINDAPQFSSESANAKEARSLRSREHIKSILSIDDQQKSNRAHMLRTLNNVVDIYKTAVKPMEDLYNFPDLNRHAVSDNEILAKPLVLLVGPWSTGKTSMINYLLGVDEKTQLLLTGAEPTTSDFTVVMHGDRYRVVEGLVLATDPKMQFSALEKFGQGFLEKFQGIEMACDLLQHVTIVDTPGIIENRKQQERGYPYNDVMRWLMERADLILVVFDPSKLDVGAELESLFKELKGHESQLRIILNKADTLTSQELMRVYGALFWNFAPLINVTEPPRVYVGSFWGKTFREGTNHELFLQEETSLLMDLQQTMNNLVENKIALIRQHAYLVRLHALIVDNYVGAYNREYSIFKDAEAVLLQIIDHPEQYNIFNSLLNKPYVSKYDLPPKERYMDFFQINPLTLFKPLSSHCSMFSGCPLAAIEEAIARKLPYLLNQFKNAQCEEGNCKTP